MNTWTGSFGKAIDRDVASIQCSTSEDLVIELSLNELFALQLSAELQAKVDGIESVPTTSYALELQRRVGISYDSAASMAEAEQKQGLVSDAEFEEFATILRIHRISVNALEKLRSSE